MYLVRRLLGFIPLPCCCLLISTSFSSHFMNVHNNYSWTREGNRKQYLLVQYRVRRGNSLCLLKPLFIKAAPTLFPLVIFINVFVWAVIQGYYDVEQGWPKVKQTQVQLQSDRLVDWFLTNSYKCMPCI